MDPNIIDLFITPILEPEKKEKNSRIVTKERIITSDEHRAKLEEKSRLKRELEEAKEKRKLERERKKKERETTKKAKERNAKKSKTSPIDASPDELPTRKSSRTKKVDYADLLKQLRQGFNDDEDEDDDGNNSDDGNISTSSESIVLESSEDESDVCNVCKRGFPKSLKKQTVSWIL